MSPLAQIDAKIDTVLTSQEASDWLKQMLRTAISRDCVDAANDADVLAELLSQRCEAMLRVL